ncbi:CYTH and CHAD domain-containing protein [Roseomonas genomospecies 6]|uniref:CHAD domain-containing protein n=1 Tax=Roseomonas genomospecies 6 TaxID=214106 RepID=A0A9W7TZY1_9PROT|nr:CYTH and CHAD domain-containing protein [Roseomonas genomospecies 6]KAA0682287.1 CHAD domain-containing protein [Roseomonas genomospecies 6]
MSSAPQNAASPGASAAVSAVREVEMKLLLDPRDLARVPDLPALKAAAEGAPAVRRLRTVYYDTPDRRLFAGGVALRVRQDGDRFVQTLKTINAASPGDSAAVVIRKEWDWAIPTASPDMAPLDSEGVAALVPEEARKALVPLFTTEFRRTTLLVRPDALTSIEVAVDEGRIIAGTACALISEVELELKSGRVGRLFDLALTLQRSVPVRIGTESKAEVGYRLVTGRLPAPALPEPLGLSPVTTVAEAYRHIVRHGLRLLLANEACALAGGDVEGLHQMRVALRRLRTAIRLFRPLTGQPDACRAGNGIRWFSRQLGPARDWDVLLWHGIEPFAATAKAPADTLAALAAAVREARRAPAEAAVEAIQSPRCAGLILALGSWLEEGAWQSGAAAEIRAQLDRPMAELSGPWLAAQHAKALKAGALKAGRGLDGADAATRDRLRRRLRKLRHTVEFFRGLYAETATVPFIAALDALLGALDAEHDAAVARDLLRGLSADQPEHRPAADATARWLAKQADKRRKALPGLWKTFREGAVFW